MPSLLKDSPYKAQQRKIQALGLLVVAIVLIPVPARAAEPIVDEDIPEEVLRSEILLDGRSPVTGSRLSATEYAEMQSEIEQVNSPVPQVAPKLRRLVGLIKLRKFIKTVLPIVPIK